MQTVPLRDLWQEYFEKGFRVGSWFFLKDGAVGFGDPEKPNKSRPWIVGREQPGRFGVEAFPRSMTSSEGLWQERHSHPGEACYLTEDAWIQIYDPQTLEFGHFTRDAFSCMEPNDMITRLVATALEYAPASKPGTST